MKLLLLVILSCLKWLIAFGAVGFAAVAIYVCAEVSPPVKSALVAFVLLVGFSGLFFVRTWQRRLIVLSPLLAAFVGWYSLIQPKLEAPWAMEVALLPEVDIQGDVLTVRHIRDFRYRSETDFDVEYFDKVYDLAQVRTVDLFLSYWGTTTIAHTIMSFGFANGDYLPISIETRKERGESYSAVEGFFKKFELVYVIADERDVIGVRVNQRNEDVYLYRLKPTPSEARKLLVNYLKAIDELEHRPRFYNALTTNCTTSILPHIREVRPVEFSWSLLANGSIDRWRYEAGVWGFKIPFEEFRRRSNINGKVHDAIAAEDFSARIREGLPSMQPDI